MPAPRVIQFFCKYCDSLIELHDVNKNYIEVVIKDIATDLAQGRGVSECALEALKIALLVHMDEATEVITLQEAIQETIQVKEIDA